MVSLCKKAIVALTLCGACLLATGGALGQTNPRFRLTDLGIPTDGAAPHAYAINAEGQAVGEFIYDYAGQNQADHAFLWLPEADYSLAAGIYDLTDLAGLTAAGQDGAAFDINDDGIIVGKQDLAGLPEVAFVWDMNEYDPNNYDWAYDLGSLFTGTPKTRLDEGGAAYAASNSAPAVVVGVTGDTPLGFQVALPFGVEEAEFDTLSPLSDTPADEWSTGYDVNTNDPVVAVGSSTPSYGIQPDCFPYDDAVRWDGAGSPRPASELPAFLDPNNPPDYSRAEALGVDEQDPPRIVGWGLEQIDYFEEPSDCMSRALFWEWDEQEEEYDTFNLGSLVGGSPDPRESVAEAIRNVGLNDALQVVGADTSFNDALMWERDGGSWSLTNLFDEISTGCNWIDLYNAMDINVDGWITGRGVNEVSDWRVYVLTPLSDCPEDVNGDEVVDIDDLFEVLGHWGDPVPGTIWVWDVNNDCTVDFNDVTAVLNAWGPCAGDGDAGDDSLATILYRWLADGGAAAMDENLVTWDQVNACLANDSEDGVQACLYGLLKK